jgi:hypothetical protein
MENIRIFTNINQLDQRSRCYAIMEHPVLYPKLSFPYLLGRSRFD